ncbi:hypothetical protein LX15_004831 [Streptoalloteichus tenebrarius]|uniref:Uncharacterized protein n=1 Tax=Streptoalloteichus tenebrarius (strain ATCC 17920 / DSM 40477 / JCM 4838 / CBS 697.72 / NBRC 16177 / NCIMB 11028 / NRRL B-12390 / A12253. 1 / ISP 5477) TaxID=1933 RepID=A0ABT1I002_STRSD|nr:hypothetical protein [Streptoalloteichus tenebrarius]MCP2261111.1 hypothetical protein [Streptoalloteichus tenebrarius]BFF03980.1 hypothetical protein GCM10020241_56550 [Streptoalloteichus tenebrarius]
MSDRRFAPLATVGRGPAATPRSRGGAEDGARDGARGGDRARDTEETRNKETV